MQKVRIYLLLFSPVHDKIIKIQKIQFLLFILSLEHKFLKLSKGYKMNRRKFLTMSMATALALPAGAWALDYRAEKPAAWTAKTVDAAIKALYGDIKPIESGIELNIPKVSSRGDAIPVKIKSNLSLKSLSVFQNVNPESTVATFTINDGMLIDYMLQIKMAKSGSITAIGEGRDGQFYKVTKSIITSPGCEG